MDKYLKDILQSPINFAQTREDPNVEINALQSLDTDNLRICLISSGGDTLASIMASEIAINRIDVVDFSMDQIYLAQLKIALIQYYALDDVNVFLCKGSKNSFNILNELSSVKLITKKCYSYWLNHNQMLSKGVNQQGRFEILFQLLNKEPIEKCFDHQFLTLIFGENATKYSMKHSFSQHFKNILQTYQQLYANPSDNYFYYQISNNEYPIFCDRPIYLTKNINEIPVLEWHQSDMLSFLKPLDNDIYHLIHLSNITDWLDPKLLVDLFNEAGRVVRIGGKIIVRRLNSDTELLLFFNDYYQKHGQYHFDFENVFDKSHFYIETIVLTKKN